jgi:CheY-like chemotaxis protein
MRGTSRESFTDEPVTAGNRPRVLVIGEDDVRRRLISNVLRKDGYDVLEKRNTTDALALFGENMRAPDAVVGGGHALLETLRERGWQTPVILMERARDSALWKPDAAFAEPIDVEAFRTAMLSILWPRNTLPAI